MILEQNSPAIINCARICLERVVRVDRWQRVVEYVSVSVCVCDDTLCMYWLFIQSADTPTRQQRLPLWHTLILILHKNCKSSDAYFDCLMFVYGVWRSTLHSFSYFLSIVILVLRSHHLTAPEHLFNENWKGKYSFQKGFVRRQHAPYTQMTTESLIMKNNEFLAWAENRYKTPIWMNIRYRVAMAMTIR